ncbi:hypothetical protein [Absicoccus porci]|uniref:hypothetical protein n=1 Tax=Absicoccus porci TaxID=2486576 RepID=UPI00294266C6|nr:hypothetical protein [Absicoccus porci]
MTTFISSLIVIFVVSLVMSLLMKEKMDKKYIQRTCRICYQVHCNHWYGHSP